MMTNFKDLLEEQLKNPEFRAEWDALQPERAIVQAMIDARKKTGLTQKQLPDRTGIAQSNEEIGRIQSQEVDWGRAEGSEAW